MSKMACVAATAAVAFGVLGASAAAAAVQIDLSSYVNADLSTYTQGFNYPTGSTTIGGIDFTLAPAPSGGPGPGALQTDNSSFLVSGLTVAAPKVAYTIINSAFGQFGQNVGSITFTGSGGASVSYTLTEGDNVRDHFFGVFNNVATGVFATKAYLAGAGVPDGPGLVHFDVQKFDLTGLGGQDLASITFDGNNAGGGEPFLAAVTTGGVPEPATWALLAGGFGLLGASMRRRRALA